MEYASVRAGGGGGDKMVSPVSNQASREGPRPGAIWWHWFPFAPFMAFPWPFPFQA